ncbi:BRO family protein [Cupriavidus basilensis]
MDKDGQSWFCATDLCAVLGYANSRSAVDAHCPDLRSRAARPAPASHTDSSPS